MLVSPARRDKRLARDLGRLQGRHGGEGHPRIYEGRPGRQAPQRLWGGASPARGDMLAPGSMQEEVAMGEYDRWQGRYAAPEYIFGEGPNAFLAAQRHLLPARGRALARERVST